MAKKDELLGSEGIAFGLMDGIITILGVLMGLIIVGDKEVLIIGTLAAGIADSFANAAGLHVSQESIRNGGRIKIWKSLP